MKTEIARFEQEAAELKPTLQRSKAGSDAKDKLALLRGITHGWKRRKAPLYRCCVSAGSCA
jgi:hypothetical protein